MVPLPGLFSGHISSWKPPGIADGPAEHRIGGRILCPCHLSTRLPYFPATEITLPDQVSICTGAWSLEAKFHMETQGPCVGEASTVHAVITFPILDVLTRLRILGGNRSQVELLGKQATKYIRNQRFSGGSHTAGGGTGLVGTDSWRVESADADLAAEGAPEGLAGPQPVLVGPQPVTDGTWSEQSREHLMT